MAIPSQTSPSRLGRVPWWLPVAVALGGAVWFVRSLDARVAVAGFESIDAARARFTDAPGFTDPRWELALRRTLAAHGSIAPDDRQAIERLGAEVAALPFVAEVSIPRVLWPGGLELDLRLRRPVAAIERAGRFLTVDGDGVVLPGAWPAPPGDEFGHLPLLLFPEVGAAPEPGERLAGEAALATLAVARSLADFLGVPARSGLGSVRIAGGAGAEGDEVVLLLAGGRAVLFGRSPDRDLPGDLPEERRWAHVREGLAMAAGAEAGGLDWHVLDARFDTPGLLPRGEVELVGGAFAVRRGREEHVDVPADWRAGGRAPRPGAEFGAAQSTSPSPALFPGHSGASPSPTGGPRVR